mmetsp:Transcript_29279/g.57484  ORF Transcript_29279/g.57484 Transcript_29279/m.57484 type:complete len:87 (-) Transcript_29279:235-495(-)
MDKYLSQTSRSIPQLTKFLVCLSVCLPADRRRHQSIGNLASNARQQAYVHCMEDALSIDKKGIETDRQTDRKTILKIALTTNHREK